MIGSDDTFGEEELTLRVMERKQKSVIIIRQKKNGQIPEDYYVWWGYEDQEAVCKCAGKTDRIKFKR